MAFEQPGFKDGGREAAADLSGAQFKLVKLNSSAKAAAFAAATDLPYGVLNNAPIAGDACEIVNSGITKVVLGGTVAAGDPLMPDATGRVVTCAPGTDTTKYQIGICLEGGAVGNIGTANVNCIGAGRAA